MTYRPWSDERVEHAVMWLGWHRLTFLHWPYDVADVSRLLPPGLEPEPYDGAAWVGVVPFLMQVRPPAGPVVPWAGRFPETNVRTYVRDAAGRSGVWFLSLDVSRLGAVVVGRSRYRLPYMWSAMRVGSRGDLVAYRSRRRWPGPRGAGLHAVIEAGPPYDPAELDEFDHYLTARFALYQPLADGGLARAVAHNEPWRLRRAAVVHLDQNLVQAAGLPAPPGEPIVHYADGVDVRISAPARVGA